jgi:hypothetical protein
MALLSQADQWVVGGVDTNQRGFVEWWDGSGEFVATGSEDPHRGVLEAGLRQAKDELERVEARFAAGIVGGDELETARGKVKILEAQLTGDDVLVAKARLQSAHALFEMAASRFQVGVLPAEEYEKAKGAVAIAEAVLREAEATASRRANPPALESNAKPRATAPASATNPIGGIEFKVAQQQLEKTLTDLQETQTQLLLLQAGTGAPAAEQEMQNQKLQYRLKILQEQSARLRELILQSAPNP